MTLASAASGRSTTASTASAKAAPSSLWLQRVTGRTVPEAHDPTIPLDTSDRDFVDVFGSLDDDTMPQNVTRLRDPRRPES